MKWKSASEHKIDLTNKTEAEPLIRKSTINDFTQLTVIAAALQEESGEGKKQFGLTFNVNDWIHLNTQIDEGQRFAHSITYMFVERTFEPRV